MPFANVKVPAGSLTAGQKEAVVQSATDLLAKAYGEAARPNTMVLVEEKADGGWRLGDRVLTLAMSQVASDGGASDDNTASS